MDLKTKWAKTESNQFCKSNIRPRMQEIRDGPCPRSARSLSAVRPASRIYTEYGPYVVGYIRLCQSARTFLNNQLTA
jgi:hypothetical protein